MSELTEEQVRATESMTLDQIRELALKESDDAVAPTDAESAKQARGADGKFVSDSADKPAEAVADANKTDDSTATIYRKEIDNGNGSVDVYEADSLEELVEKLAMGKLNANKKIQEFIAEKKASGVKEAQISADEEYVIGERLKKKPKADDERSRLRSY